MKIGATFNWLWQVENEPFAQVKSWPMVDEQREEKTNSTHQTFHFHIEVDLTVFAFWRRFAPSRKKVDWFWIWCNLRTNLSMKEIEWSLSRSKLIMYTCFLLHCYSLYVLRLRIQSKSSSNFSIATFSKSPIADHRFFCSVIWVNCIFFCQINEIKTKLFTYWQSAIGDSQPFNGYHRIPDACSTPLSRWSLI